MRTVGAAFEFGVELGADHERMLLHLDDFRETCSRPDAGENQTALLHRPL